MSVISHTCFYVLLTRGKIPHIATLLPDEQFLKQLPCRKQDNSPHLNYHCVLHKSILSRINLMIMSWEAKNHPNHPFKMERKCSFDTAPVDEMF
jgi:hypothetical protein